MHCINLVLEKLMKRNKNNEIDDELCSFFQELLDKGVNGGLLTYLLCRHAMQIALSAKVDHHKLIYNLLSGLMGPVSEGLNTKPQCISSKNDRALNDNNPPKLTTH